MTELFGRVATLTVGTLQIKSLDFSFRIEKSLKPEPNTCEIQVFNLTKEHAAEIAGLAPKTGAQAKAGIPCKLEAGYEGATSLLWHGDLRTAWTRVEGEDRVTTLSSGDGEKAIQNARINLSFGPKTSIETVLRSVVRALGVGEGNLSKVVALLKQAGASFFPCGFVCSGSAADVLHAIAGSTGLEASVQDRALLFLERGKPIPGQSLRLSSETGLIESPTVDNEGVLTAKALLIPGIRPGVVVVMDAEYVKGGYRVERCTYTGDTSGEEWGVEFTAKRY